MGKKLQLLYQKILVLRAGEKINIALGEYISIENVLVRLELESTLPKIFTVTFVNSGDSISVMKHIKVDKVRYDLEISKRAELYETFNELRISVPEDSHFHLGIYLKLC